MASPQDLQVLDFVVRRDDLSQTDVLARSTVDPAEGELAVEIQQFALTSNNITYAVVGDAMGYWNFFPAAPDLEPGWGRIPAWGFAKVVQSRHPDVPEGEVLFGFVPMSSHAILRVGAVSPAAVIEGSDHRKSFHAVYNQMWRVAANPMAEPARADHWCLMWPLFMTALVLTHHLIDHDWFGAERVVLTSASSKTSLALAHLIAASGKPVIGLTSAANLDFARRAGSYAEVRSYEQAGELDATPTAVVDVAGNAEVLTRLRTSLADALVHCSLLGATHREAFHGLAPDPELPGATPELFFAPEHIQARLAAWGLEGLMQRFAPPWAAFLSKSDTWLEREHVRGPEAIAGAYASVLDGELGPTKGLILSLLGA